MSNQNEAEAKRDARAAMLARAWGCDSVTAAKMAEGLGGLTDAEFEAHANWLAERRASIDQAKAADAGAGRQTPSQQTTFPCPAAYTSRTVKPNQEQANAATRRDRVSAEVQQYMAGVFDLEDEDESVAEYFAGAEQEDVERQGRRRG
jgi:hypothetical protein